jgi:glycosyltransferase involved in cell wall biosynthesis
MAIKNSAIRILYFTIVDIGRVDNGGGLVCRNHAARIAETSRVALTICNVGPPTQRAASEAFARQIGADFRFLELDPSASLPEIGSAFIFEREAAAQTRVHGQAAKVIDDVGPDIVVVDYLFSALYAPCIYRRRDLRRITITLNNESRFLKDLPVRPGLPISRATIRRLWLYEQSVYARSHAVVALNASDIVAFPWLKRVVIAPILGESAQSWQGGDGNLLFVGNANHFPNRQAVEWLCVKFAPEFAKRSAARIVVVGAGPEDVASGVPSNVDLLGLSTTATVEQLYQGCGLFMAPIANNYGSKIKLLQCLSLGTPFLATSNALTGLRDLDAPLIALDDAPAAAAVAAALLEDHGRRAKLSKRLKAYHSRALDAQRQSWRDILHS